ncbi:1111_t:CDS:10, partial [Acaulospora colombiana]
MAAPNSTNDSNGNTLNEGWSVLCEVSKEELPKAILKRKFEGEFLSTEIIFKCRRERLISNLILELSEKCKIQSKASVSVVTFLGLTNSEATSSLSSIANAIVEKTVFGQSSVFSKSTNTMSLTKIFYQRGLWIYCDPAKNTIYLLLDSINDSDTLLNLWRDTQSTIENGLAQPISKLDANLVSLLRTISSVKRHVMPHANNFMNLCWQHLDIPTPYGPSSISGYGGRLGNTQGGVTTPGRCVPFLLFLFLEVQLSTTSMTDGNKSESSHEKLFTLPPPSSQFFVHLIPRGSTGNLLTPDPAFSFVSSSRHAHENNKIDIESLLRRRKGIVQRGAENFEIKLFKDFTLSWIKWAATGYPRSFVKRGVTSSELPNAEQWISGSVALRELLFGNLGKEILERKSFSTVGDTLNRRLKDCVQINNRFSASHCAQVLRKAIDIYLLESPTYYNKQYHDVKLERALRFYMPSARGPCIQSYAEKLKEECRNIWERGRQKCEKRSLSGHECVLGLDHDSESSESGGGKYNVKKVLKHRSSFQPLHACNCGRSRKERDDPFDLIVKGNQFLLKNVTSSTLMWSLIRLGPGTTYRSNLGLDKMDGFATNANFLLPMDISSATKKAHEEMATACDSSGWTVDVADGDSKTKKSRVKGSKQKGKSGEEQKNDIGAAWPSLGSDNVQNDVAREIQQNPMQTDESFIASDTKGLKGGDMSKEKRNRRGVRNNPKKDRTGVGSSTSKDASPNFPSKVDYQMLKGYLGVEYECPIGHRFMSCGRGQVCKLGHAGHIKETANTLLEQDLPIYIICPCNSSTNNSPTFAQLQRVVIVTPDSSALVALNPIIKETIEQEGEVFIEQGEVFEEQTLDESGNDANSMEDMDEDNDEDRAGDVVDLIDDSIQGFFSHQAVSGGGDDKSFLWRTDTGEQLYELTGHTDTVTSVMFSKNGEFVASGGMDGKILVWKVDGGELVASLEGPDEVMWIDWHPKGTILLAGANDASIWMWQLPSGNCMNVFSGHSKAVTVGQFTPDGKKIVSGSDDSSLIIWDPKTASPILKITSDDLRFHQAGLTALATNKDSTLVLTGSMDNSSRLVNMSSGVILGSFQDHSESVEAVGFCDVLPLVATGSVDSKLNIWDVNTMRLRQTCQHDDAIIKLKWHSESPLLTTCSADKTVRVWDARTGNCERIWHGHQNSILDFAIS